MPPLNVCVTALAKTPSCRHSLGGILIAYLLPPAAVKGPTWTDLKKKLTRGKPLSSQSRRGCFLPLGLRIQGNCIVTLQEIRVGKQTIVHIDLLTPPLSTKEALWAQLDVQSGRDNPKKQQNPDTADAPHPLVQATWGAFSHSANH